VELRGFEPLTPCMPCPCGYLEPLRLTVCSTTFPQVDRLSSRGDASARVANRVIVSGKSLASHGVHGWETRTPARLLKGTLVAAVLAA
jgi:hypothetical protein